MSQGESLQKIVADLIEVMHLQAKELEKLVVHVEQVTGHLTYEPKFSVVVSELSELHHRVKHLASPASATESHKG